MPPWSAGGLDPYDHFVNLALYMSVTEAAQAAGISTAYVRLLLARGQLRGEKVGHSWLVLREDVGRFVRIGRGPVAQPARLPARPAPRRPAKKSRRARRK